MLDLQNPWLFLFASSLGPAAFQELSSRMCPVGAVAARTPTRTLCFRGAPGLLQRRNRKLQKQQTRASRDAILNAAKKPERLVRVRMRRAASSAEATFNLGPRMDRARGRRELSPRTQAAASLPARQPRQAAG